MTKKPKPVPTFRSEAEERRFWETHDSTEYVDWSKAERTRFPNLKRSQPIGRVNSTAAPGDRGRRR
jgi:hypothetical protein